MISSDAPGIRDVVREVLAGAPGADEPVALEPARLGELTGAPCVVVLDASDPRIGSSTRLRRIAALVSDGHAVIVLDGSAELAVDHHQVRHVRIPVRAADLVAAVAAARVPPHAGGEADDPTWTEETADYLSAGVEPEVRWEVVAVTAVAPSDEIRWIAIAGRPLVCARVEACRALQLGTMSGCVLRTDLGLFWFPAAARVERRRRRSGA